MNTKTNNMVRIAKELIVTGRRCDGVSTAAVWDQAVATTAHVSKGTSQLVTRSTHHIVKSCDKLTVVFHGITGKCYFPSVWTEIKS